MLCPGVCLQGNDLEMYEESMLKLDGEECLVFPALLKSWTAGNLETSFARLTLSRV